MKKRKFNNIRRTLIVLLVCVLGVLGYLGVKNTENLSLTKMVSRISITYVKAKNIAYTEKPLSELKDSVFLTLLDKDFKVISTTDPNKTIHSNYTWTETSYPRNMIRMDSKLYLLIEMSLEKDQIKELIKEDIHYYMDLPSYISPSDDIILSDDEEEKFYQQGQTKAYGGIYSDGPTGARFKIRFENVTNKIEITANYQLKLKLKKKIEDQITELKSLNFGSLGVLQFFYQEEAPAPPPVEKPYPYTLTSQSNSTSSAYSYEQTIKVTDQRNYSDRELKGLIKLNLSTGLGFEFNMGNNFFKNLKIYFDGTELSSNRIGNYQNSYYYQGKRVIDATIINAISDIAYNSSGVSDTYNCANQSGSVPYSCLLDGILLDIGGYYNESIKNVQEIKIVVKEKIYTKNTSNFTTTTEFIDNTKTNQYLKQANNIYKSSSALSTIIQRFYGKNGYDSTTSDYVEEITIPSSPTNYIELNVSHENSNLNSTGYSKYHYYLNSFPFDKGYSSTGKKLDDTLSVYINGDKIDFIYGGYYIHSLVSGQCSDSNPALYKQMEEIFGNNTDDWNFALGRSSENPYQFWRSKDLNERGEYYWLVFSRDTIINGNENGYYGRGRGEYVKYTYFKDSSSYSKYLANSVPDFKLYLFNISYKGVQVNLNYRLSTIERVASPGIAGGGTHMQDNIRVQTDQTTRYSSNSVSGIYYTYMNINGEKLNNNNIKWNVELNLREVKNRFYKDEHNSLYFNIFYLYLPKSQTLSYSSDGYYDQTDRIMKYGISPAIFPGNVASCDNSVNDNFNYPRCTSYQNLSFFRALSDESFEKIDLWKLNKSDYQLYQLNYGGAINLNNDNASFSFITRIEPGYENKNYEEIYFQLGFFGGSAFSQTGSTSMGINYAARGVVQNQNITAKHLSSSSSTNNKKTDVWQVSESTIDASNSTLFTTTRTRSLPIYAYYNEPAFLNGVWQYSAKHTDISAAVTKLKQIYISISSYNMPSTSHSMTIEESQLTNIENKFCDGDICVYVNFLPKDCREGAYNNTGCLQAYYGENYLDKLKRMDNGFSLRITGIENGTYITTNYTTETDNIAVRDSLNTESATVLSGPKNYTVTAKVTKGDWYADNPYYYNNSASKLLSVTATANSQILADLAVDKSTSETYEKKYRTKDTTTNSLTATIGYSETDSVDIKDIILGFDQYKTVRTEKLGDTISTLDAIEQLKKYLRVENLKIKYYKDVFSSEYETVYENGTFTGNWNVNSTYETSANGKELYSLHLQPNSGQVHSASKFVVEYKLILDIDNMAKVADEAGKILETFRNSEYYAGGNLDIISTAEAARNYTSSHSSVAIINPTVPQSELMRDYVSYVDTESNKLYCYTTDAIKSGYLQNPYWEKGIQDELAKTGTSNWDIIGHMRSTGKDSKPSFSIRDIYNYRTESILNAPSDAINELNDLLLKHSKVRNLVISYKENEYQDAEYQELYRFEKYLKETHEFQTENGIKGTIQTNTVNGINLTATIENLEYDSLIKISYSVDIDFESFYQEALSKNLLDSKMKIADTEITYRPAIKNTVLDYRENKLLAEKSSGYINVTEVTPIIKKQLLNQNNDMSDWKLEFNTGYSKDKLILDDKVTVTGNDNIKKSIIIDNVVIKVNDEVAYNAGTYGDGWEDYLTLDIKNLSLKVTLKESESNPYIARNSKVVITYNTHIDRDIYGSLEGSKNGDFSISNTASLSKKNISSMAKAATETISFNFPLTFEKKSLGTVENKLYTSRWNLKVQSGSIKRTNLVITDIAEALSGYTEYLMLSDLTITKTTASGQTVLYDYKKQINNLAESDQLLDKVGKALVFNKAGAPEFIIKMGELEKEATLSIDYTLEIDTAKYEYQKKAPDVKIEIKNQATLETKETALTSSAREYVKVISDFTKSYTAYGTSSSGLPLLKWTIDLNLLVDYHDSLTDESNVIVEDELDDLLKFYDDSLEIWRASTSVSNRVIKEKLVKDVDYTFALEENTVKIKILKPLTNNCLRINFKTEALSSTNNLQNYLKIGVEEQFRYIKSDTISKVNVGLTSGLVTSKGISYYTIHANKYLDGNLTNKRFRFVMQEVDYNENVIDDTKTVTVTNQEDGSIEFIPIELTEAGVRYFKIQELSDGENYNYDSNKYLLKLNIVEYKGEYIVESSEIVNSENSELNFYNTTKQEPAMINPQTLSTNLIPLIIVNILTLGGIVILKKKNIHEKA